MFDELARKSKVVGLKQVSRAIKAGELEKVYIAADADEHLIKEIKELAEKAQVKCEKVPSKKKLGAACGINVSAACAGICR